MGSPLLLLLCGVYTGFAFGFCFGEGNGVWFGYGIFRLGLRMGEGCMWCSLRAYMYVGLGCLDSEGLGCFLEYRYTRFAEG